MSREKPIKVFKRTETDEELRERLLSAGVERWRVINVGGKDLDDTAWAARKMQRKIVDDAA